MLLRVILEQSIVNSQEVTSNYYEIVIIFVADLSNNK